MPLTSVRAPAACRSEPTPGAVGFLQPLRRTHRSICSVPFIECETLTMPNTPAENPETETPARATSFGTFKPVGHVMVGLPDRQALNELKKALNAPGVPGLAADELTPTESADEMQALIDNASPLAGFGYEITLMRRYVKLARQGSSWLIVKTDSDEDAQRVAELAKSLGATLAVRYGMLLVEDLI